MPISTMHLNTKLRLTMLCLSGFEVYCRWVPLMKCECLSDVNSVMICRAASSYL